MKEVRVEGFIVTGPHIRTNNKFESDGSRKIPDLWKQFYAAHSELESQVYGVYSNYESDVPEPSTIHGDDLVAPACALACRFESVSK